MVQQRRYKCVSSRSIHAEQALCASSLCASSSGSLSTDRHLQQEGDRAEEGCAAQQEGPGKLPMLPSEVIDQVLGTLKQSWQARPSRLAKDEVREWTQYSLVCKAWQAAFEDIHLCIEFHEAPSKQQVAWLRSTRTPIQRITFLPSCTPCRSTASAYIMRPQDTIRLCPGRISEHPPYLHSRRIGAAA